LRLALTLRLLFFAFLFFVTATYGQIQSDWERANEERIKESYEKRVAAPPLERSRLVEVKLDLSANTEFRYYVDREYRVYAVGKPEGGWAGRASEWRPIPPQWNSSQAALARQYFCPGRAAIKTSEEGQKAVRAGGHPGALRD
jgi:hypothetical protein